ncbi:MAG: alcohol dehydrogenase catalytic domain-containing protein [Nitrosomonadales bacterium]|nr:alcohol dehydrogenase catalytic domain-containing protein [Nitrosomonadales bacterium]
MKVGMYYNNRDVRVEEMPVPEVGEKDILIKVRASGICGSDIMEWYRIKRAPLVLGHEVTGEVVKVGSGVTKFAPGDRVFTIHHVPCDECEECLKGHHTACRDLQGINYFEPGGFSEFLKVSGKSVDTGTLKLPPEVSYEEGTFIEPLGTVLRGLRTADVKPGESVLILGSGLSGLLYIKAARALGAGNIIAADIRDNRLKAAARFGATHTVNASEDVPAAVKKLNGDRLADKVIICTGALPAISQALDSVERGGTVLFFAVPKPGETVPVDFNPYWRNDISFKTSYGSAPLDHYQALELIRRGNIDVKDMITTRLPLGEIAKGFAMAAEGKDCLKVIIEP